jgi:hypothetical protein
VNKPRAQIQSIGAGPLAVFLAAALLASLYASWRLLAAADFLYPLWYDVAEIGAHIDRYGPENRYRDGFEDTSRAERLAAFAAIGRAVRDDARGLESLTYEDGGGRSRTLLRPPEIVHLQDVSRLIGVLERAGVAAWIIVVFAVLWLRRRGRGLPGLGKLLAWTGGGVAAAVLIVLALGPRDVFYHFHEWVFPDDHQWFFYYQDSLMSTLMKAPYLFGYIAAALVALGVVLLAALLAIAARLTDPGGRRV